MLNEPEANFALREEKIGRYRLWSSPETKGKGSVN